MDKIVERRFRSINSYDENDDSNNVVVTTCKYLHNFNIDEIKSSGIMRIVFTACEFGSGNVLTANITSFGKEKLKTLISTLSIEPNIIGATTPSLSSKNFDTEEDASEALKRILDRGVNRTFKEPRNLEEASLLTYSFVTEVAMPNNLFALLVSPVTISIEDGIEIGETNISFDDKAELLPFTLEEMKGFVNG
jgi:hypothetical protein